MSTHGTQGGWRGHGPWELWFVWYPVMADGESVWLQTVERRYQYREIDGGAVERRWMYQLLEESRQA